MATKNKGVEGWMTTIFCPAVLNKMQLSCLFLTRVCLFIELTKLQFGQFLLFVFVKFRKSYRDCLMKQKQLILQFLVVQISSAKFQSMCFTLKI